MLKEPFILFYGRCADDFSRGWCNCYSAKRQRARDSQHARRRVNCTEDKLIGSTMRIISAACPPSQPLSSSSSSQLLCPLSLSRSINRYSAFSSQAARQNLCFLFHWKIYWHHANIRLSAFPFLSSMLDTEKEEISIHIIYHYLYRRFKT